MITDFPFDKLGHHDYGWLDAHYHFSFADYHNQERNGFPPLVVWNDDRIQPGTGFPMHSHMDMEIITYVRKGSITHEDSLGNKGLIRSGEIQIMSAGTGITHSEYNHEDEETLLFQIWLQPNKVNLTPRWEKVNIHSVNKIGICPLASGEKKIESSNELKINQDATLYLVTGNVDHSIEYQLESDRHIYLVVSKGDVIINKHHAGLRDACRIFNENNIKFIFKGDTELIFLDLPIPGI